MELFRNAKRKPGLFIFLERSFRGLSNLDYFGMTHSPGTLLAAEEGKGNTQTWFPKNFVAGFAELTGRPRRLDRDLSSGILILCQCL